MDLDSDTFFEILTRITSLKTLDTCKCVCKNWKHVIYQSMPLYCKATNNLSGYFIQHKTKKQEPITFIARTQPQRPLWTSIETTLRPYCIRILASSNQGLVILLKPTGYNHCRDDFRYYISKPATDQYEPLPNPKRRYKASAVAIVVSRASPLRYKIVRLSELYTKEGYSKIRCEIFDSNSWAWREIQSLQFPDTEIIIHSHPAVSVGNSPHWLTNEDNVLVFHEVDESFNKFPLPQIVRKNAAYDENKQLVDYQGRLGFTCFRPKDKVFELWLIDGPMIMDSYEWTMKMNVNISSIENVKFPYHFKEVNDEVIFYDLYDYHNFSVVELDNDWRIGCEFFQFRSDLEPVDLRCGRPLRH